MSKPVRMSDESAGRLRRMLYGPGDQPAPERRHGGSGNRVPTMVRCTSATAAGGTEVGHDQCYPAVVVNINSLVDAQEDGCPVWLTILTDGVAAGTPVDEKVYYGLFAGNFDPFPLGATDPRPRVFATVGATGPTGGTIQVEDVDESPTVASVAQLRFDSADGFVVSSPGAGIARVDMLAATATQAGIVSTAAQTIAGNKDFDGDVNIDGTLTVGGTATINSGYTESVAYATDTWQLSLGGHFECAEDLFVRSEADELDYVAIRALGASYLAIEFIQNANDSAIVFHDPGGADESLSSGTTPWWVLTKYGVKVGGTLFWGITGTRTVKDGSGNNKAVTIKGGIITDWEV